MTGKSRIKVLCDKTMVSTVVIRPGIHTKAPKVLPFQHFSVWLKAWPSTPSTAHSDSTLQGVRFSVLLHELLLTGLLIANPVSVDTTSACSWSFERGPHPSKGLWVKKRHAFCDRSCPCQRLRGSPPEITPWEEQRNIKAPNYNSPWTTEQTTPN